MFNLNFLVFIDDAYQPLTGEGSVVFCEMILHVCCCVDITHVGAKFATNNFIQLLESHNFFCFFIKLARKIADLFIF